MQRLCWLLPVVLTLAGSISISQAQTDDEPPYLYYYSRMLGGIIIERADGTDSRHIGAEVIPPGMTGLAGPGWSPSGRYFAAFGMNYGDYYVTSAGAYLMNSRGDPAVEWLTRFIGGVHLMEWAPNEDILLIVGSIGGDSRTTLSPILSLFYWLIDPEHQAVVAEFGAFAYGAADILWELEQDRIRFFAGPQEVRLSDRYFEITMMLDGTVLRLPATREAFNSHYTPAEQVLPDYYAAYGVSPSGRYEAEGARDTALTDTHTGETVELPRHSQGTICRGFVWSEDEQHIITLTGTLIAGGGCFAAVMGVTDSAGELWRELGGCSWDFPPCIEWLPEYVDVNLLPSGSPTPVQLDPVRIEHDEEQQVFAVSMMPDVNFRLRCGERGTAEIVDTTANTTRFRLRDVSCPYTSNSSFPDGLPVAAVYLEVQDLLATFHGYFENYTTLWIQQDDGTFAQRLRLNSQGFALEFTEDGVYLRARNVNGWKVYAVTDILAEIDNATQPQGE